MATKGFQLTVDGVRARRVEDDRLGVGSQAVLAIDLGVASVGVGASPDVDVQLAGLVVRGYGGLVLS